MTIQSRSGLRLAWVFAILWNLIAAPATFLGAVPAIQKGNTVAWAALFFPFAGASLLIWAVHLTLRWRRFGTSQLDIGGDSVALGGWMRGRIATHNLPQDAAPRLTFSCINRIVSGSGSNRSVWEKVLWQEEQSIPREGLLAGPAGAEIPVAFRLPADQPATRSLDPDNRILWRLQAYASIPGVDYKEQFEIPVAAPRVGAVTRGGAVAAAAGSTAAARADSWAATADPATAPAAGEAVPSGAPARPEDSRVRVETGPEGGTRFILGAARNIKAAFMATFFGALFCGLTALLAVFIKSGAVSGPFVFVPWIMLTAFAGFSVLIVLIVVQAWLQSTVIDATSAGLVITGRVLGLSHIRSIPRAEVRDITLSIGMQTNTTPYYDLVIAREGGTTARVTASLRNKREAEWLAAAIKRALG